jgi:hypothetical protein
MIARFQTTSAFYVDSAGLGRVRAGKFVADSQANAQPGDMIWLGLNSVSLPRGMTPLDPSAVTMRNASQWAGLPVANVCFGVDSVDG